MYYIPLAIAPQLHVPVVALSVPVVLHLLALVEARLPAPIALRSRPVPLLTAAEALLGPLALGALVITLRSATQRWVVAI